MNLENLTDFFMWCSVINGALLLFWTSMIMSAPNLVYRIQSRWFPIPRETFDVVVYSYLGLFKIVFIAFNLVPYVALRMIG